MLPDDERTVKSPAPGSPLGSVRSALRTTDHLNALRSEPLHLRLRCRLPQTGARLCRASAMRLRAQRREVLPNLAASLRSESGWPSWTLAL